MIEQVLIRVIAYTSRTVIVLCAICIIGPIVLFVFVQDKSALKIYTWYSTIMGAYGALKIIGIGIISAIIQEATNPFVDVRESEKKE
jgi:hypothetical protein